MSNAPQGDGWWQASDDRWYPPELHPGRAGPPQIGSTHDRTPGGYGEAVAPQQGPGPESRPRGPRNVVIAFVGGGVLVIAVLVALAVGRGGMGNGSRSIALQDGSCIGSAKKLGCSPASAAPAGTDILFEDLRFTFVDGGITDNGASPPTIGVLVRVTNEGDVRELRDYFGWSLEVHDNGETGATCPGAATEWESIPPGESIELEISCEATDPSSNPFIMTGGEAENMGAVLEYNSQVGMARWHRVYLHLPVSGN